MGHPRDIQSSSDRLSNTKRYGPIYYVGIALLVCVLLFALLWQPRLSPKPPVAPPPDELAVANAAFDLGNYDKARSLYHSLISTRPSLTNDLEFSIALCNYREGKLKDAAATLRSASPRSLDDKYFKALVLAKADDLSGALEAIDGLPEEDISAEPVLLEELAKSAAKQNKKPESWRYYSLLEQHHPLSDHFYRLQDLDDFDFTSEFFGHGFADLKNYGKGFGTGVLDNVVDTARALWQVLRHPVKTYEDVKSAVAKICTQENLDLLLSPRRLKAVLGDTAAKLFWSAWTACKASAVREYNLDLRNWDHQRSIHEIAAGRMFGYVAPELAMILIPAVKAPKSAIQASKIAEASEEVGSRVANLNRVSRSADFLSDAKKWPFLEKVSWETLEDSWRALKSHPRWANRLDDVADWIYAIRDIPGAENLVKLAAGRVHIDDGYLFQLYRAAEYAKKGELKSIGQRFYVDIASPGQPAKLLLGDADLVLKDGTLVETKLRSGSLSLSDVNKQLLKYNKAIKEDQYKKVRIECSGGVDKKVYERAKELEAQGTPIEIVEHVPWLGQGM